MIFKKDKTNKIESMIHFFIERFCDITKSFLIFITLFFPYCLCLIMGIKGKNKYFRLLLGSFPLLIISMVLSSWYLISNPISFANDAFGTAQGLMKVHKDVKQLIIKRMPDGSIKLIKDYGLDHAVNMVGNATGLKKETPSDKAKNAISAPINWFKGFIRIF